MTGRRLDDLPGGGTRLGEASGKDQGIRRALVVTDDTSMEAFLTRSLKEEGFVVDVAAGAAASHRIAHRHSHALSVIDFERSNGDVIALIQLLRAEGFSAPIVLLTGEQDEDSVVAGLDAGADDHLVKPVSRHILQARCRALLRRGSAGDARILHVGPMALNLTTRRLYSSAGDVDLSMQECSLFELLIRRQGQVVTRTYLLAQVWGLRFDPGTNRVDVAVSRLRQKLARLPVDLRLESVRGVGYRLSGVMRPRSAEHASTPRRTH